MCAEVVSYQTNQQTKLPSSIQSLLRFDVLILMGENRRCNLDSSNKIKSKKFFEEEEK
jgi:hypothetical protein